LIKSHPPTPFPAMAAGVGPAPLTGDARDPIRWRRNPPSSTYPLSTRIPPRKRRSSRTLMRPAQAHPYGADRPLARCERSPPLLEDSVLEDAAGCAEQAMWATQADYPDPQRFVLVPRHHLTARGPHEVATRSAAIIAS
jgi:hypothetical protein